MTIESNPSTSQSPIGRRSLFRIGGGVGLAAIAGGALSACGTGSSRAGTAASGAASGGAAATQKIRLMYASGDETFNGVVKALTDEFNKTKKAVLQSDPLPAAADYATALKTMDATNNWPSLIDMRETNTYMKAGKLAPIPSSVTDLLAPDAFGKASDGSVYAVPVSANNGEIGMNIVYDKGYFEANGLKVPTTYAEFIALMDAIKAKGQTPLATAAGAVWPSDQLWKPLASAVFAKYSDNGGFWTRAIKGEFTLEVLKPTLEQLKMIIDKYTLKGWEQTQDNQLTTLLVNKQAVMATSSAGMGRLLDINKVDKNFKTGMFIIPSADGTINVLKNALTGDTAGGWSISKQAKDKGAEYDAAVEFLKWLYTVEGGNLMEKMGMIAPNIKDSDKITRNTSIPGSDDYFGLLKNPKLKWFENNPTVNNFSTFNTFFRQARIEMQSGQTTVDQCIAKCQAELAKLK